MSKYPGAGKGWVHLSNTKASVAGATERRESIARLDLA